MKVIVAGSRDFNNFALVCEVLDELKDTLPIDEIVCGCARGADTLGKMWADKRNVSVKLMPADWDKYGKSAGIIRNHQMGDYADYLIAFWDGRSRGTKDMIDYMKIMNKHGKVVLF